MIHKMTSPKIYTRGTKLWIRYTLDGRLIRHSLDLKDNKINRRLANTQIIPQLILKINRGNFSKKSLI